MCAPIPGMSHRLPWAVAITVALSANASRAQEPDIRLDGTVPEGPETP